MVVDVEGHAVEVPFCGFTTKDDPIDDEGLITTFSFGYAVTGHKSQGSEWKNVLVVDECPHWFDRKRWRYTAFCQSVAVRVGSEGAMSQQAALPAIDELDRLRKRFTVWRMESQGRCRPTKVPYIATKHLGGRASDMDPSTWRSLGEAQHFAEQLQWPGVMVALGDLNDGWYLAGVDLDSCIDDDGNIAEWADKYIDLLACTYIEVSPSGHGMKAFFSCNATDVPEALKLLGITDGRTGTKRCIDGQGADHAPAVELCFAKRFFCLTMQRWPEAADRIESLNLNMLEKLANMMPQNENNGKLPNNRHQSFSPSDAPFRQHAQAMRADPDLASWVSEKGDQRQLQRTWDRAGSKLPSTEDGLAMLFADLYSDRLRYCHDTHRWHEWDGDLWRPQRTDLASHWVRLVCRDSAAQHQQNRLANVSTASGVEKFARADPAFAVEQTIRGSWVRRTARWTCGRDGCAHRCRLTRSARQPACRRHKWRIVRYGCTSWMR